MKKLFLSLALLSILPLIAFSQFSIKGKVIEKGSKKSILGAHVIIEGTSFMQVSNFAGEYSFIKIGPGTYKVTVSHIGFKSQTKTVKVDKNTMLNFELEEKAYMADEVLIVATKVPENSPTTFKTIDEEDIEKSNLGQDLPMLLEMMPSTITTSDAGAGVGYTGMRIRGTDVTRINVTINGIPYNEAESHGVYWVNLPDIASSVDNIQIQRGVGTSTNGAAAFGATINLQTTTMKSEAYANVNSSAGSFNTFRNNIEFGTGLVNGKFTIDGRLSKITSDGFIDRATSDLKSFFVSAGFYGKNTIVKLNIFSGKERTYQAWGGVPKEMLKTNRTYNPYTYENEVDDYQQDHYQLHFSQKITRQIQFNAALHYTYGRGYFEQYKEDRDFADYSIAPLVIGEETIDEMDLIQQKWLDNDFYGTTYSLKYENNKLKAILGGAWNKYDGDHFGEVIWSEYAVNIEKNYRWYFNTGTKRDFNIFAKMNYQISPKLNIYGDLQFRSIKYEIDGIHDDLRDISQTRKFDFINPKAGVFYEINEKQSTYASVAVSHREPSRSNYRDADESYTPHKEFLIDYEFGYRCKNSNLAVEANAFYMDYKDQLVLTGKLNNVGEAVMTNVDKSYRVGVELAGAYQFDKLLKWELNATISQNKIKKFTNYVDNVIDLESWEMGEPVIEQYKNKDLSFSPNVIIGNQFSFTPFKNFTASLMSKYVGRQYIDNTQSKERSIDAYFVSNFNLSYKFKTKLIPEIGFNLLINNIFDEEYESSAWAYRYFGEGTDTSSLGYFPQAGTNFLFGVSLKF